MGLPAFLLRKLYRKGSLREVADGRFAFVLHNPLGDATLVAPPDIVVNGIRYRPDEVETDGVPLETISPARPLAFARGEARELRLPGRLLRGGNRIHVVVQTREYGELEIFVEDKEADYCEVPFGGDSEE